MALGAIGVGLALSHRRRWLLMGAGAIAGLATLLVPTVAARVAVEIDLSNPSNTLVGRSQLWSVTLQMLRDHPIFGAGLAGFTERIGPYWNPAHADRFIDPHNILLNFWVETGVLGVVAFTWILITAFRTSWRGWHMSDAGWTAYAPLTEVGWHPIHVGVFLALVGIVVHGLVDVPYFKNDLSLEFWVLAGLTWAGVRWMGGAGPSRTPAASARQSSAS
jgi:O-antigen ligase